MSNNEENKQQKVKTASDILKDIEQKNFSGKLGQIRKKIEDLVPQRDKAREAYDSVETQLRDLLEEYDEVLKAGK